MSGQFTIGNRRRPHIALTVGDGSPVRLLASLGLSPNSPDIKSEYEKAEAAAKAKADILNDDSIVEPLGRKLRKKIVKELQIPLNSEPIFSTSAAALQRLGNALRFSPKDLLETINQHAEDGVDIMTIHFAYSRRLMDSMATSARVIPMTSRGGAILSNYMINNKTENPYHEIIDDVLKILSEHNVTLSLGTVLRPASIVDGCDDLFVQELSELRLALEKAQSVGVNVMVEGAGHIGLSQIESYVQTCKQYSGGAPLRTLGPTTSDRMAGFDHISGCIGAAVAALHGCDLITCTTRAEHLGLPRKEDIVEAIEVFRVATSIGYAARQGDFTADHSVSAARRDLDWAGMWRKCLFAGKARALHAELNQGKVAKSCSICGQFCALTLGERCINTYSPRNGEV